MKTNKPPEEILSPYHWQAEKHVQRMTASDWKKVLLASLDYIAFRGTPRRLIGKRIGCGVVEVSKEPIERSENRDG